MRKVLVVWLVGWAVFGFPWTSFTPRPRFSRVNVIPFRWTRRRDQLLNFVYYVPFGVTTVALGWHPGMAVGAGAALSGTTELVQIFSTDRFPSIADLFLNTAGTVVGIAVGSLLRSRWKSATVKSVSHG